MKANRALFALAALMLAATLPCWPEPPQAPDAKPSPDNAAGKAPANCRPALLAGYWPVEKTTEEIPLYLLGVFENGRWRAWESYREKVYCPSCTVSLPFVCMDNPKNKFIPSKEGLFEDCGGDATSLFFPGNNFTPKAELDKFDIWNRRLFTMASNPTWSSEVKPAKEWPALAPMAIRMRTGMQPLEEETAADFKQCPDRFEKVGYDPKKLLPAEMVEVLEFEISPKEPVLFITMQQRYPGIEAGVFPNNASVWHTIVRKNNLETIWSQGWINWNEKSDPRYQIMGAADANGDGISEVVIGARNYGGVDFEVYEYRNKVLAYMFTTGWGC